MILKDIVYNNGVYTYYLENGETICRDYVLTTSRIGHDIFLLKIPIIEHYFLLNEIFVIFSFLYFLAVILFVFREVLIHSLTILFTEYIALIFHAFLFSYFTKFIFTIFLSQCLLHYSGKFEKVEVIQKKIEPYTVNSNRARYFLLLKNGKIFELPEEPLSKYNIGDIANVKIHPDYIPYLYFEDNVSILFYILLWIPPYLLILYYNFNSILIRYLYHRWCQPISCNEH